MLSVASFVLVCGDGTVCIPQPGTAQLLDSVGDRVMHRLEYRNFGDHETLVVNHSVMAGGATEVRWYELRNPSTTPTVFQQAFVRPSPPQSSPEGASEVLNLMLRGSSRSGVSWFFFPKMEWS